MAQNLGKELKLTALQERELSEILAAGSPPGYDPATDPIRKMIAAVQSRKPGQPS